MSLRSSHGLATEASRRKGVHWERLELRGFGPHDHLVLDFPDGLGTLIRPNEWGKSTILAGLSAVLFGLPSIEDPAQFGARRYRSWTHAGPFDGSLTFVAGDGRRYTLERHFDDHGVRLLVDTDDGPEIVHDGTHNPRARKRNVRFEDELVALLGVKSRDTFIETFCVTQPLPDANGLSDEVQRLLVGSGRGSVDGALSELVEQVAKRTRSTGKLGVTRADRRTDGESERLEEELRALDASLAEGREAADRAQQVTLALNAAQEQVTQGTAALERLQAAHEARREYLELRRRYDERREAVQAAERALVQAVPLELEATEARRRVEQGWPDLVNVPEGIEDGLIRLRSAGRTLNDAQRSAQVAREAAEAAQKLLADRKRARQNHALEEVAAPPATGTATAIEALESEARRASADWSAHLERQRAIEAAGKALEQYAPMREASEEDKALLRRYDAEAGARVHAVEACEAAVREARTERRRLLVPDATLPSDVEAEAIRAALAKPASPAARLLGQIALGALVLVAAFLAARRIMPDAWALALAVVMGLAAAGLVRPSPLRARSLGRFRGRSVAELAAALEAYDAWRLQPAPSRSDLRRLEIAVDDARESLDAFSTRMRPFQQRYAEPGVSFEAMRDAERRLEQRESLHAELSQRVFGAAPEALHDIEVADLAGAYPALGAFATQNGAPPELTLPMLFDFLSSFEQGAWKAARDEAAAAEAAARAWADTDQQLKHEIARAESVLEERQATLTQRRAELNEAERLHAEAAAPYGALLVETGLAPDELLERCRERDKAIEAAERPWDALASLLAGLEAASVDALRDRLTRRKTEAVSAFERLEELVRTHPDLPAATVDDAQEVSRTLEAVEARMADVRAELDTARAEMFERTRQRSELLGMRLVNIAQVEEERSRVAARSVAVAEELEALCLAHAELAAAVHDFQGGYRERLERLASNAFALFTGSPARRVRLADDFTVTIVEPDGTSALPTQLSQGAQDQLLLALRLAIADHMADDAPLPMVLDDPFLNWDQERLERARRALAAAAGQRQILLLSHRPDFRAWGSPVHVLGES